MQTQSGRSSHSSGRPSLWPEPNLVARLSDVLPLAAFSGDFSVEPDAWLKTHARGYAIAVFWMPEALNGSVFRYGMTRLKRLLH